MKIFLAMLALGFLSRLFRELAAAGSGAAESNTFLLSLFICAFRLCVYLRSYDAEIAEETLYIRCFRQRCFG